METTVADGKARAVPGTEAADVDVSSRTEELIVQAAIRLFSEQGYEATSVRQIVTAVGVTKPVLYYYFKNKEELFRYIIETSFTPFEDLLDAISHETASDFWAKLEAIVDLHITWALEQPDRVRFLHAIFFSGLYDDIFDFESRWEQHFRIIVDLFQDAQDLGLICQSPAAEVLASCFVGMAHEAMRSRVYCPGLISVPASSGDVVRIFREGIQT